MLAASVRAAQNGLCGDAQGKASSHNCTGSRVLFAKLQLALCLQNHRLSCVGRELVVTCSGAEASRIEGLLHAAYARTPNQRIAHHRLLEGVTSVVRKVPHNLAGRYHVPPRMAAKHPKIFAGEFCLKPWPRP